MTSKSLMGLVSAGNAAQSFLTRLPALQARLGPIKANSSKAAKQAAKSLPNGYSVSHYSALEMCELIWVAVPEPMLDRVIRDLVAQMPVHKTMIVLCDSVRESHWSAALGKSGARVASLNAVEGTKEKVFTSEGHPQTLSLLKRLLWKDRRRLVQMEAGAKPLYLAGLSASTDVLLPWVDTAVRLLRAAGFTRAEAMTITEAQIKNRVRDYANTGAKCWGEDDAVRLRRLLHDLPQGGELEKIFVQGARYALEHFPSMESSAVGAG